MNASRIIKGVVGGGRYTVTAPITQWDYGYIFQPIIEDLPATYRLDFSNDEHSGTAYPVYCDADGGEVPQSLIDTGKDIFVWLFYIGDGFGKTEHKWRIPNKLKPKNEEETPEPSQQSSIDQLIVRSNEAVETAEASASEASTSAQSAKDDADRAEQAKDDASTFAQRSAQSAQASADYSESASQSAQASAESASQSAQIKTDVKELAEDAQGYADSARQSASQASASEQGCARAVLDAASAAAIARARAEEASGYAQTASTKASEASQSAQTASQKATEASQSATYTQTYASQAETAKTEAQTAKTQAESARDSAITAKNDAESARDEAQNLVDGISGKVEQIDSNTERIESLEDDRYKPYAVDSASGSIASFTDGADDIPLKSLVVDINPVQDLHGQDAPYPAGGGKNKITATEYGGSLYSESVGRDLKNLVDVQDYTENENVIVVNVETAWRGRLFATSVLPAGDYHVHFETAEAGTRATIYVTDADLVVERYITNKLGAGTTSMSVTLTDSQRIAVIFANYQVGTVTVTNLQVESGSVYTSWTPYENICPISGWTQVNVNHSDADMTNPTTITIDLGQTVYGGKLDVLSGVLTVDMAMVDLGTLTWNYVASLAFNFRAYELIGAKPPANAVVKPNAICSILPVLDYTDISAPVDGITIIFATSVQAGKVWAHSGTYTDAKAFKSAVTGQTLVYELAEPIEIQLSANQINSLYGVNNIWADSGDTTCEYRADTKAYIAKKIAEALASLT